MIEQFTEEEAKRVKEAQDLDLLERGMGVKRRLYEALCVRGLAKHELNPHKDNKYLTTIPRSYRWTHTTSRLQS